MIGNERSRRGSRHRRTPRRRRRRTQQAPLALGGAPKDSAAGVPGGARRLGVPGTTPGGAGGQVPPQGRRGPRCHRAATDRRMTSASGDERLPQALLELDAITRRLRRECPWDRAQDERSIVPHTVEEAYELANGPLGG